MSEGKWLAKEMVKTRHKEFVAQRRDLVGESNRNCGPVCLTILQSGLSCKAAEKGICTLPATVALS
jgi:hypothetical protein